MAAATAVLVCGCVHGNAISRRCSQLSHLIWFHSVSIVAGEFVMPSQLSHLVCGCVMMACALLCQEGGEGH